MAERAELYSVYTLAGPCYALAKTVQANLQTVKSAQFPLQAPQWQIQVMPCAIGGAGSGGWPELDEALRWEVQ